MYYIIYNIFNSIFFLVGMHDMQHVRTNSK